MCIRDSPYIVVNPYLVNPLTAMILFKTEKEEAVTLTVKGKEAAGDITHTFPKAKEQILPVLGLYPEYANTAVSYTHLAVYKRKVLKQYFGYDEFREGQELLIDSILSGRDTLGIMPTGAGKSLCFQIPALMMEGITLVISPLISLMKDQVEALNQAGIHAAYLNSSLTASQYYRALAYAREGRYPIIYVAPERLVTCLLYTSRCV